MNKGKALTREMPSVDKQVTQGLTKEQAEGILRGDPKFANLASQLVEERSKRMAPEGALHLPPLLDKRRVEYAIPDGVFAFQAAYDKVLIYQLPEDKTPGKWGDTQIIMPDTHADKREAESPIGIVCGAGCKAMDVLASNGMGLGHIVAMVKMIPWVKEAESILGHKHYVKIVTVGDILGSRDLAAQMHAGEIRQVWDSEAQSHVYVNQKGERWATFPIMPETAPEI